MFTFDKLYKTANASNPADIISTYTTNCICSITVTKISFVPDKKLTPATVVSSCNIIFPILSSSSSVVPSASFISKVLGLKLFSPYSLLYKLLDMYI